LLAIIQDRDDEGEAPVKTCKFQTDPLPNAGSLQGRRRVRRQEPAMSIYRFRALIVLPLETSRHRDKDSNTNDWCDGRLARPEWARVARRQAQGD